MIRLGPAGYIDDDGHLHFNLAALCREQGVEPTPENQQAWMDAIAAYMAEYHPELQLMVKESPTKPGSYVPYSPRKGIRPCNTG